jgi:predicted DNA-binding protein (MmcQ/YjbR family)
MDADSIRKYCLAFSDATETLQWEDELCFKVRGKIFVMLGLDSVPQRLCFKCAPDKFAELCEFEDIRPAPYVGRYKWVMLDRLEALPDEELKDCIRQSYDMVESKYRAKTQTLKRRDRRGKHKLQALTKRKKAG